MNDAVRKAPGSLSFLSTASAVVRSLRPPFLLLTPACILLAIGAAVYDGATVDVTDIVLLLIAGLAAHASVNAFNEYFDFRSGLDTRTERTPFSGGSGALIERPDAAVAVLGTGMIMLAILLGTGAWFVGQVGPDLLVPGILGVALIVTYTQWLSGRPVLSLLAPGTGFGLLIVLGSYHVLTGGYSLTSIVAAVVPFFLVNNLLLLNQFPDLDADRSVGRQHFLVAYGHGAGASLYGIMLTLAITALIAGVIVQILPPLALVALVPMTAGLIAWRGAMRYRDDAIRFVPYMAANVIAAIGTPAVLGIELLLS